MDIKASLLAQLPAAQTKPVELKNWFTGRLLHATVVERSSGHSLLLKVQDQLIEARSQQPVSVRPGESLVLKVIQNGNPAVLKLIQQNPLTNTEIQQQLLRESLPRQSGLEKMNAVLQQVQAKAQGAVAMLPTPVKQQLQKIINSLPTPKTLNTDHGVKTAITDSGLFLEAKLLSQAKPRLSAAIRAQIPGQPVADLLANDFKANLLQLSRIIRQEQALASTPVQLKPLHSTAVATASTATAATVEYSSEDRKPGHRNHVAPVTPNSAAPAAPGLRASTPVQLVLNQLDIEQLGKQVEAALARIETNQARAIVTENQPLTALNFEIPVRDKDELDLIKLGLEQHKHETEDSDRHGTWTVNLHVEFESGGSLSARVSMFDSEMNVSLWSNENDIDALIERHMPGLNEQFQQKGLHLNQLQHIQPLAEKAEALPAHNLINVML